MSKEIMHNNDIYILGEKIFLRSLRKKDASENWWKWFNDDNVTRYMAKGASKNTIAKQVAFFERITESKNDLALAICDAKNGFHVGTTALHDIDWVAGSAQFGIIIGEEDYWGQGIGTEAWSLLTDFGFRKLKLKLIKTKIFKENSPSLKIAKKCGFKEIALLQKDVSKNGGHFDRYLLELTKIAWEKVRDRRNS